MSLTKFLCQNRSDIHTIFRKIPDWSISIKQFFIILTKDDLFIKVQLVNEPSVVYSYKGNHIHIILNNDEEVIVSCIGDPRVIQTKITEALENVDA
jgi:hypothetical protein